MEHIGDFRIDDYVVLGVQLHRFSSGAVYAPTGDVTYTIYENNSANGPDGNPAAAANLAQLNTKTGLYTARIQLTAAAGYEAGKDYIVHYEGTVDSVAAAKVEWFRVIAEPTVDVTKLGGVAQSATDLKDFADTGYDPVTHALANAVPKSPATLATADVTGNLPADLKAITVGVDFSAAMKTSLNAATPASVTGAVGSVAAAVTVGTNNDKTGYALTVAERTAVANAVGTRAPAAESYAADGAIPTYDQFLFMLWAALAQFAISGTTLSAKKLDGTTQAMTFTLDDDAAPTSRVRAS